MILDTRFRGRRYLLELPPAAQLRESLAALRTRQAHSLEDDLGRGTHEAEDTLRAWMAELVGNQIPAREIQDANGFDLGGFRRHLAGTLAALEAA